MARTRANRNAGDQAEPANQGGRGRGRGRGRGAQDEQVGGRGDQGEQVVGRGRGRGGRGRGRGAPNNGNPQDLAAIINQTVAAFMPTLVAQVAAAMGGGNVDQEVHEDAPIAVEEPVNVEVGGGERVVAHQDQREYRQGCSYKDFKNCGPPEFDGSGGAVGYMQWIEKMEAVIARSNCTYDTRITYVTGMLSGDALSWWNSDVIGPMGRDAALGMDWAVFKEICRDKYCPPHELQKLQLEFTQQQMNGSDYAGYTRRFNELASLVPHLVTPESRKIEKYVFGLTPQVRVLVSNIMPTTMRDAVNRAGSVTEELVRSGVLGKPSDSKKREAGESSGTAKGGRFDPKRQRKGKAFAAVEPVEKG